MKIVKKNAYMWHSGPKGQSVITRKSVTSTLKIKTDTVIFNNTIKRLQ